MRYRVRFSLDLRVIDEFIRIVSSRLIELYTASVIMEKKAKGINAITLSPHAPYIVSSLGKGNCIVLILYDTILFCAGANVYVLTK